MVLLLLSILSLVTIGGGAPSSPVDTAIGVAKGILNSPQHFLDQEGRWSYGAGVVNLGLYEVLTYFNNTNYANYSKEMQEINDTVTTYLDLYLQPNREGWNVLNNVSMFEGYSVGDHLGLYPISYLARYIYLLSVNKSSENDLLIATRVAEEYVYTWPITLHDGTIARYDGWNEPHDRVGHFLWSDDSFMGIALLAQLSIFLNNSNYFDRVVNQTIGFASRLQDSDGLYKHGWSQLENTTSCCKWGRANGWAMMGIVEVLIGFEKFPNNPYRAKVLDIYQRHSNGIFKIQDQNGLWHQVLDAPQTYLETSASAMFLYAISIGLNKGWLDDSVYPYSELISVGWMALSQQVNTRDGIVSGICEGCGIQTTVNAYQAKSTEYQKSLPGLGSILRAAVAVQKLWDSQT